MIISPTLATYVCLAGASEPDRSAWDRGMCPVLAVLSPLPERCWARAGPRQQSRWPSIRRNPWRWRGAWPSPVGTVPASPDCREKEANQLGKNNNRCLFDPYCAGQSERKWNGHSQFETLVKDGVEIAPLDARLLLAAIWEEAARKELDDDEGIAEPVGIQRDDVPGREDFYAQTVVMEVNADAENAVRSFDCPAAVQLLLLAQPSDMVEIDQLLRFSLVQRDLLFDALVRRALERVQREALIVGVQEIYQHLQGAVQSVVKLAEFVLQQSCPTITTPRPPTTTTTKTIVTPLDTSAWAHNSTSRTSQMAATHRWKASGRRLGSRSRRMWSRQSSKGAAASLAGSESGDQAKWKIFFFNSALIYGTIYL